MLVPMKKIKLLSFYSEKENEVLYLPRINSNREITGVASWKPQIQGGETGWSAVLWCWMNAQNSFDLALKQSMYK